MSSDKKAKDIPKQNVHQIINLDDSTNFVIPNEHMQFVSDLANQCGSLLNWVAEPNSDILAESLWRNKMRIKACHKFDQLDTDQIRKLVDRDWRIMSQAKRKEIILSEKQSVNISQMENKLRILREKIVEAKQANIIL